MVDIKFDSPENQLMEYLATICGIPLRPFVERDSHTGAIVEVDSPYAIMGDVRVNHRRALNSDFVTGGFVISGFFKKDQGRLANNWSEFMRRKLYGEVISVGEYRYTFNTVRTHVRKDITTLSILHRATITVTYERNNERNDKIG